MDCQARLELDANCWRPTYARRCAGSRARVACRDDRFVAGIGDRWDDNELHAEIGWLSVILLECAGD